MKDSVKVGKNITGLQSHPIMKQEMTDEEDKQFMKYAHAEDDMHPELDFKDIKQQYIREAGDIGTIPPPATLKGMAVTGFQKLTGEHPEILIDKLGERLGFERSGTRLYDAFIAKCEVALPNEKLDFLYEIREEEARHFTMLKEVIQGIGGDPTAMTPCADVAGVAGMGLMQVINDPRTSVAQSAQAILIAELTDNDGWELLIKLVDAAGMKDTADKFREALRNEEKHLATIRAWLEKLTMKNDTVSLQ